MLRSRFGDELYRRAIRRYLEQHALTHVETEELRAAFEDLTGETLDRFFDQWVYHGRHPELKIAYKWMANEKLAHVTIEQQQDVNEEVLQFEFSTKLRFIIDGRAVDHPIDVSEAKHDFYVRLPAQPTIVRFDPDYTVLADIEFSKPNAMLEAQLSNGDDVVGRLYACEALGKRDAQAAVDALQNALQNDAFYGVRQAAAESLREIGDDRACQALADSIKQSDARVRLSVVQQLAKFYRSEAREKLLTVAQQEKNPEIAAAAVEGLDKYQGPQVDQALRAALTAKSFRNEAARAALRAIGQRRAHEFQAEVVAALNQSDPELDAETVVLSLKTLAKISESPKIRPAAFDVITRFLEHPRQRYRIEAVRALGELGDQRAYAILRPLVEDDRDDRLSKAADAALKKLDEEARLAPKEVAELRKEVRSLKEKMDKLQESLDDLEAKAKPEDDKPQEEKESVTHRFTQLWFC